MHPTTTGSSQLVENLQFREKVIDQIRRFFKQDGFIEVDTPLLVRSPGTEPYLDVFSTKLQLADERSFEGYLLTSPEYAMKKLLAAGMEKNFTICKSFRNSEGIGSMHNHEFTIMEWYRTNADYRDLMDDCELLIKNLVVACRPDQSLNNVEFQGASYDLSTWQRFSVAELFVKLLEISVDELTSDELLPAAQKHGYAETSWDDAFTTLMMNHIDPFLAEQTTPVFIYDYPIQQAALAKPKKSNPHFAERFELYIGGIELANAFSELTDADEQRKRFESELSLREKLGKVVYSIDEAYLESLQKLPPTAGIALGVDRLVMFVANASSIKEVIPFPIEELFDLE